MSPKRIESPRILIAEPGGFSPRALTILQGVGQVDLQQVLPRDIPRVLGEVDVFWFRLAHRIGVEALGPDPRCRILATPVTGLDHINVEECRARGIRVVSLRGETEFLKGIRATAELTAGLALALLRNIPAAAASVREGRWDRDRFRGRELHGKTAGLIGVGRLGSLVAGYFKAFGMRVLGFDPRSDYPLRAAARCAKLEELLESSDLVSIHSSYGPATHALLGPEQFARMKPGAILVNTSRGAILDESALIEALRSGHLSGAALDVLTGEPDVDDTHLVVRAAREMPNLLVVPHIGGSTFESFEKTEVFLAGRVVEVLREMRV